MTLKQSIVPIVLVAGAIVFLALFIGSIQKASGYTTYDIPTRLETAVLYDFFASSTPGTAPTEFATSTTATSTDINAYFDEQGRKQDGSLSIAGAERVTLYLTRGSGTSGATIFRVQGTQDGTNWHYITRFIGDDAASTATSSVTMGNQATSTSIYGLDLRTHGYQKIRCIAVEITDGRHQCQGLAEW